MEKCPLEFAGSGNVLFSVASKWFSLSVMVIYLVRFQLPGAVTYTAELANVKFS